ncbi:MAG TPA: zf-HC2 domain-containing protein [Actinomycetota bacterium]|nr:zf-HC2 domain-containing protein [Actinomycetota bacterium]
MADIRCEEVREMLPAYAEDELTFPVRRHLGSCGDCRAELVRYEEIASGLSALATVQLNPPVGLLPALRSIPEESGRVDDLVGHFLRNRAAYLGGAAVVAAGAAGAALWRSRRRLATA